MLSICAHCGRTCGDFEGGWGKDEDGNALCHPNVSGRPNCYVLVTNSTYGHGVPCRKCGPLPDEPVQVFTFDRKTGVWGYSTMMRSEVEGVRRVRVRSLTSI